MKNQKLESLLSKLESLSTESHGEISNMTAAIAQQLRGGAAAIESDNAACSGTNYMCTNGSCSDTTNNVCSNKSC